MSEELSPTAKEVLQELEPGTRFEDKIILSKRQLLSIAGAGLSAGALATFGIDEAAAQAAGSVGTSSEPVDVEGYNVTAANSLVDPAGTTHNGELADASDTLGDHDNGAHTTNYAPDGHGNEAHSTNFADQNHGNEAHSATFLDNTDVESTSTADGYELTVQGDTYQFLE